MSNIPVWFHENPRTDIQMSAFICKPLYACLPRQLRLLTQQHLEDPGLNPETGCPEFFVVFLNPSRQVLGVVPSIRPKPPTSTSFRVLSSLTITSFAFVQTDSLKKRAKYTTNNSLSAKQEASCRISACCTVALNAVQL
jgi:hypothetical protein